MIKRASGMLGPFEPAGWYSFTLAAPALTRIDLGTGFGTATVGLYGPSGQNLIQTASASTAGDGWIDRTLASGTYTVMVSSSGEAAYSVAITTDIPAIGSIASHTAGTSQATAFALGTLGAVAVKIPEWVGPGNAGDWYAFSLATVSALTVTVSGLSAGVTLTLRDAAGQTLGAASGSPASSLSLLQTLGPGSYFLDLEGGTATGYSLSVAAPPAPERAGPSLASATDLGVLVGTTTPIIDQLNAADTTDSYQFRLASASAVAFDLSGLTAAATITLFDGSGAALGSRSGGLHGDAWLNADLAPLPGSFSYKVQVTGQATPYILTATGTPYTVTIGLSPVSAIPVGTLDSEPSVSMSGTLLPLASRQYYSFTLTSAQTVDIAITGSLSAALQVFTANGSQIGPQIGTTAFENTDPGTLLANYALQPGTYFAAVSPYNLGESSSYSLQFSTGVPAVGTPAVNLAGTNAATAEMIGVLGPVAATFADWVGPTNPSDFYQFTLGAESFARLDLTGLSAPGTVSLLDATGHPLGSASGVQYATYGFGASLTSLLAAGSYGVQVTSGSIGGTGYSLSASAQAVMDVGGTTLANAAPLGTLGATRQSVTGSAGPGQLNDYYRFSLTATTTVNLSLSQTNAVLSVILLDGAGQTVSLAQNGGGQNGNGPGASVVESASLIQTLAAGSYSIDVRGTTAVTSPFTLTVGATPVPGLGGVTAANATALGTLRSTAGAPVAIEDFGYRGTVLTPDGSGGQVFANAVTQDTVGPGTPIHFIDGTLYDSPADPAAQVLRLYRAALGRAPDQGGLAYWTQAVQGGTPLDTLSASFLGSAEFSARFGGADPSGFVTQLYQNVLSRTPDAGGLNYWVGRLAQGTSEASVLSGFSESDENKAGTSGLVNQGIWVPDPTATQIARLYDAVYGRKPDLGGLNYWLNAIETSGSTMQQVTNYLISSPEFLATYGGLSNGGFVQTLYQNTLHRAADAAGLNYWLGELATGMTSRAGVVLGFSESAEHQASTAAATGLAGTNGILFLT